MDEAVRLSKRVAALVACSRSEAERYIDAGWVRVDGQVVDTPQARVTPGQQVTLDKEASLLDLAPVTLLVHQPVGAAPVRPVQEARWPADAQGVRVLTSQLRHLQPLLPLPRAGSGLAIYSQDRRIVRKLMEEGLNIEQEWVADVTGTLAEVGLSRLAQGLAMKASWQSEQKLRLAFKGIDPARLPALCQGVGLAVTGLRRIRIGRVPMAGLPVGMWRGLQAHERF